MIKPPVVPGLRCFVGRETLLKQIEASLQDPGCFLVNDSEGVQGAGKTTWLAKLYELASQHEACLPLWVGMADFYPCHGGEQTEDARTLLVNNLEEYQRVLVALASQLPAAQFGGFADDVQANNRSIITELLQRRIHVELHGQTGGAIIHALSQLKNSRVTTGDVVVNVGNDDVQWAITQAKDAATRAFVDRLKRLPASWRPVLFIDDFCWVADQDLGRWFLHELVSALGELHRCLVVVAHCHLTDRLPCAPDRLHALPLGNFSFEETRAYLAKRFDRDTINVTLAQQVFQLSGGHPQAAALAADIVLQSGVDQADLAQILARLPAEHVAKMTALVDGIAEGTHDADVVAAMVAGSVVRRFDGELLTLLMADDNGPAPSAAPSDMIRKLERFSFTERHESPDGHPTWKFHEFIRRTMVDRLKANDPQRLERLHQRAAVYYARRLTQCEESRRDATPYQRWYRFEDPAWQSVKLEWLYHLTYTEGQSARVQFARAYFDAFWWWGCYVAFPFCEQLLLEWECARLAAADQEWGRLLRKFHAAYPLGYEKRGKGQWDHVEQALLRLRQLGGLDEPLKQLTDETSRHLRAVTDLFLAESCRYRQLDDTDTDAYYDEALAIFQETDDWNVSWTLFHLADLALERGQRDVAEARSREALGAADRNDFEVIANAWRVLADVAWHEEQYPFAWRRYLLAIFFSYRFHCPPTPQGEASQPDFYTQAFYQEMVDRAVHRVRELWGRGTQEEAKAGLTVLREPWSAALETASDVDGVLKGTDDNALQATLAPSGPSNDELASEERRADYVLQALTVIHKAEKRMRTLFEEEQVSSA